MLPFVESLPTAEDQRHELYCHYHRKVNHPIMNCCTLQKIFHECLQKGEIILGQNNIEQTPFPRHQNAGTVMTCIGGFPVIRQENMSTVRIEEIFEEPFGAGTSWDPLVTPLLRTKLFRNFFESFEFEHEARREAAKALIRIAQKYGPTCYMISNPIRKIDHTI